MHKSELTWILADYEDAQIDPPERIKLHPNLCEGDLMSADEVEEYVKDSVATLRILADKHSPRYDAVVEIFQADMLALYELGRLDEDEYNGLTDSSNLRF